MSERASVPDPVHAVPPHLALEWRAPAPRAQRPKSYLARAASVLGWLLCGVVALAIYTNVIADDTALRSRADGVARRHAGCDDQCHVTHMQGRRTVLGYHADYDVEGAGTIHVTCQRSEIVVGDYECEATK